MFTDSWGTAWFPPYSHGAVKSAGAPCEQGIVKEKWSGFGKIPNPHETVKWVYKSVNPFYEEGKAKLRRNYTYERKK